MSYKQIGSKHVALTPEVVKEFCEMPAHAGDRNRETSVGRNHIAWLRSHVDAGTFHDASWATCLCREDGVLYRVDGGHSSQMLHECNGSFPKGIKANVLEFVCDSRADLADVFDLFDSRKSCRTVNDRVIAHRAIETDLDGVAPTQITKAVNGVAFYYRTALASKGMGDEDARIRLIHEHPRFIAWSSQFTGTARLARVGVIAAMFATYEKDAAAAFEFWTQVRDESHADNKAASRLLSTFLREAKSLTGSTTNRTSGWDVRAYYVKSLHAWNSYRLNRKTDLKYYANAELPSAK